MPYRDVKSAAVSKRPGALAVLLLEKTTKLPDAYRGIDEQTGGVLSAALKRAEFSAGRGSVTSLYPTEGDIARLFVLGLGKREKFTGDAVRIAGAALARAAFNAKVTDVRIELPGEKLPPAANVERNGNEVNLGRTLGEGMQLASFSFDEFKGAVARANGNNKDKPTTLKVQLAAEARKDFDRGVETARGVNVARTLAATPPNVANPQYLGRYCKRMAQKLGLKCKVIDAKRAEELGMGGLTAVGRAGSTPPALIVMEYTPKRTAAGKNRGKPLLLVGKAITFDTGGYSLKINNSMLGMKYDKCGGMAVIGAMHAIASLKLDVPVVAILAAAENMVDTTAYRPNDIITMYNGVTVEVTNTDAEGRLVLADALAYGCKTYNPAAVIDLATLTGGVVVALGSVCAGIFCGDADLRSHLFDAADRSGDRLWHLPLWDEHRDMMKGNHSDIVNSGAERGAHPIQGAAFLSYFATPGGDPGQIGKLPWAHIDIAGTAEAKSDTPLFAKGPTGYGVRLLVEAAESWR